MHHVGLTVPDLDEATRFLVDHLGCEHLFTTQPGSPMSGDAAAKLNAPAGAVSQGIAMLRSGGTFVELFAYDVDGQNAQAPAPTDIGGVHLAFEVADIEATAVAIAAAGCRLCGEVNLALSRGFEGMKWLYFVAPWGQTLELVDISAAPQLKPSLERSTAMSVGDPAPLR